MQKIKIISKPDEQNPFAIIYKPQGLPSAPLSTEDKNNALSQAEILFPKIANVKDKKEIEHGLLHRIDTETEGLLLLAETQDFYDFMQINQKNGKFIKIYRAECSSILQEEKKEGFPLIDEKIKDSILSGKAVKIESYFRNFGKGQKEVRPVTEFSGKAALKKLGKQKKYSTQINLISEENGKYIFECRIESGYRHQVRCHLAWLGFPVCGDSVYNPQFKDGEHLKFKAIGLQFENPITKKTVSVFI